MKPITPGKVPRSSGTYGLTDFCEVTWASGLPFANVPVLCFFTELGHRLPHHLVAFLLCRGGFSNLVNPFRQHSLHVPVEQPGDVFEMLVCLLVKPVQVLRKARELPPICG